MKIYCLSDKDTIQDQFKKDEIINVSEVIYEDPLYLINLDKLKGKSIIDTIKTNHVNIKFLLVNPAWVPERIKCHDINLNKPKNPSLIKTLDPYYDYKEINGGHCLLRKTKMSIAEIQSIQIILKKNNIDLIKKLITYFSNNAGMFYYTYPASIKAFQLKVKELTSHYSKIDKLNLNELHSNLLYKTAFNRMDYGVSIVTEDRTILYTNKVRREYFGYDIIGKKCYDVFTIKKGTGLCGGCPMGNNQSDIFNCKNDVVRSEVHKLKDKRNKVYFISETASKIELINTDEGKIEKLGLNVVRDNSPKTISSEFQKLIQRLNRYQDIITALKFATIGGSRSDFEKCFKNKDSVKDIFEFLATKLSYTNSKNEERILNFGFSRMRYYRNHVNIFDKKFDSIKEPIQGHVLQVFSSYSNTQIIPDKQIIGKHIDFSIAKNCIINELEFDDNTGNLIDNFSSLKLNNHKATNFLKEIGIDVLKNEKWFDILMFANKSPLGYLTVDYIGSNEKHESSLEELRYLHELANFAAQAIQSAIDHKELNITREITSIINKDYDTINNLYFKFSQILCNRLSSLKCEVFSFRNNRVIHRDFLYYRNLKKDEHNKEIYEILDRNRTTKPNTHTYKKHLLGSVMQIFMNHFKNDTEEELPIYFKCINIFDYNDYNKHHKDEKSKQIKTENKIIEEVLVANYTKNNKKPDLKNCIIAPLRYRGELIGAIKITNNNDNGLFYFPIHEQRILYYVAEQLAIKIKYFELIEREKVIDDVFTQFSDLLIDSEKFEVDILKSWREDIQDVEKNIKNNLIFKQNYKQTRLVDLIKGDVLEYYEFDEEMQEFTKKEGRYRDYALGAALWEQIMSSFEKPIDKIHNVLNESGERIVYNPKCQDEFSKRLYEENEKKLICFPIFVNNAPFSLIVIRKFYKQFTDDDYKIIKTISMQISSVFQIVAFKRKDLEVMQNLSHQVIAPLTGLDTYIDQLIRNTLPKTHYNYYEFKDTEKRNFVLKLLRSQTSLVRHIASGYKHLVDLELGIEPTIEKVTLNLTRELIRIVSIYQPMASSQGLKGISVTAQRNENMIYTDQVLLFHIGVCLVDNAIKYADKDTEILISLSEKDSKTYTIQFTNFGLVIQRKDQAKIFERNYRAQSAKKRNPHGSGIGLYIVKEFSRILGGKCYVEEKSLKEGTTFTIELPKTLKK